MLLPTLFALPALGGLPHVVTILADDLGYFDTSRDNRNVSSPAKDSVGSVNVQ